MDTQVRAIEINLRVLIFESIELDEITYWLKIEEQIHLRIKHDIFQHLEIERWEWFSEESKKDKD